MDGFLAGLFQGGCRTKNRQSLRATSSRRRAAGRQNRSSYRADLLEREALRLAAARRLAVIPCWPRSARPLRFCSGQAQAAPCQTLASNQNVSSALLVSSLI